MDPFNPVATMAAWEELAAQVHQVPPRVSIAALICGTQNMISLVRSLGTILGFAALDLDSVVKILSRMPNDAVISELDLTPPLKDALERETWLLEFVAAMLSHLLARPGTLKDAAAQAYKETLAPRHTAIVRFAVSAALHFLPSREAFLLQLAGGAAERVPLLPRALHAFIADLNAVRAHLEAVIL
jgi:hypothetical protein